MDWVSFATSLGTEAFKSVLGRSDARAGRLGQDRSYAWRDQYDWKQAEDRGLTPQEFYGSPAAGGSAATAGASLGNNSGSAMQDFARMQWESSEREKDRQKDKDIAEIQTGTQRDITAEQLRVQQLIENRKADLTERQLNEAVIPAAAANIGVSEQQVKLLIEQTKTATPSFQRAQKLLSMGVENTLTTMIMKRYGIDPTSGKAMQALTEDQYDEALSLMMAMTSHSYKELQGILSGIKDAYTATVGQAKGGLGVDDPGRPELGRNNYRPDTHRRGQGARANQ